MIYSIPAKTFLIGEYSALMGGSVLGLATKPGFEVEYQTSQNEMKLPFHENSPASVFWDQKKLLLENKSLKAETILNLKKILTQTEIHFTDLVAGVGGFGRSTAEYMSVLIPFLEKQNEDFEDIRMFYKKVTAKTGAMASGADLAIQYFGKVTYFDGVRGEYSSMNWPFHHYDFILVSTGLKIKTHEHIKELDLDLIEDLPIRSNQIIDCYIKGHSVDFFEGLNEWSDLLHEKKLLHPDAFEIKKRLQQNADILSVKPCGALGADVILLVCPTEKSDVVQNFVRSLNLKIQATTKDLALGVGDQLSGQRLKTFGDKNAY